MKSLRNVRPVCRPGLTINRARDEACRQDFVSFIRMSFDLLLARRTIVNELAY